jgi:hypothetical protein
MIRMTPEEYLDFLHAYLRAEFKDWQKPWHPEDLSAQISVAMDVVNAFVAWQNKASKR